MVLILIVAEVWTRNQPITTCMMPNQIEQGGGIHFVTSNDMTLYIFWGMADNDRDLCIYIYGGFESRPDRARSNAKERRESTLKQCVI